MAVPKLLSTAELRIPILTRLAGKGYNQCVRFSSDVKGRFTFALALSAMRHIPIHYPQIQNFLEKTWKVRKIPQLVSLFSKFASFHSIFSRESVWAYLRNLLSEMFEKYFGGDPSKTREYQERGDINPGDEAGWKHCASMFMLAVFCIQSTEGGYVQQVYRPADHSPGLVSLLVLDHDILYLMLHESLNLGQGTCGLPFYILDETVSVLEEAELLMESQASEELDGGRIVEQQLGELVGALTKAVLALVPLLDSRQANCLSDLPQAISSFTQFNSFAGRDFPFIEEISALSSVLSTANPNTGDHYLSECTVFNLFEEYISLNCRHRFHKECVGAYVEGMWEQMRETGVLEPIVCPVDNVPISESLLPSISPLVYAHLLALKSSSFSPTLHPSPSEFLHCRYCHNITPLPTSTVCPQGCILCSTCVAGKERCAFCGFRLPDI